MKMRRNFSKMFDEAEIDFLREELRSRLWHHKEQVRILENDIDIYNGKIPNPHKFEMTCTKEQMNNLFAIPTMYISLYHTIRCNF